MDDCCVYIESPHKLQCKLLINFLRKTTGIPCFETPPEHHSANQCNHNILFLSDYDGCTTQIGDLQRLSQFCQTLPQSKPYTAIFNIPVNYTNEYHLIISGLNGIFYNNVSLNQLATGVRSILSGELWFSRAATSKVIRDKVSFEYSNDILVNQLTPREKQILIDLSSGLSNEQIANQRFLSTLTVKTHLQNIYKKIKVKNRSQAANWALRNMFQLSMKKVPEKE